jgi:2-keto-4-pentenoate hydratase/2-oxohepta-3-ene-1,7-dioic acid hydratase in catechol pathway
MRLITYASEQGPRLGVLAPDHDGEFVSIPGLSLMEVIGQGADGLQRVRQAMTSGPRLPLSGVALLAPIPELRRNVFCLGWNYADHSKEAAHLRGKETKLPERPVFFTKVTTTVNGPFGDIPVDARVSEQNDWEVELGVIIGTGGKNIPRDKALDHVFGYTVINDVSARDVQTAHGKQFFKGKSLDGHCPMGPWLVTKDEIADPHALPLRCRVNGELKQEGNTRDLIFDIPAIIEWLSLGMTLLPGDVIATGTPSGVGFARTPPEYLWPGDVVECEVEGIGTIRNRVVAIG